MRNPFGRSTFVAAVVVGAVTLSWLLPVASRAENAVIIPTCRPASASGDSWVRKPSANSGSSEVIMRNIGSARNTN
jgi:hypothetical protein